LNNGATPERVAGIYRRDFSPKRKLPALFRAITKLGEGERGRDREACIESDGNREKREETERERGKGTPERTAGGRIKHRRRFFDAFERRSAGIVSEHHLDRFVDSQEKL